MGWSAQVSWRSPHLYICLLWSMGLVLFAFREAKSVPYEIKRAAVAETVFPYGETLCMDVTPQSSDKKAVTKRVVKNIPLAIDINSANKKELMSIKGIGEVIAGRIITLRQKKKRFSSIDELLQVKGIGKKKLEAIKAVAIVKQ